MLIFCMISFILKTKMMTMMMMMVIIIIIMEISQIGMITIEDIVKDTNRVKMMLWIHISFCKIILKLELILNNTKKI